MFFLKKLRRDVLLEPCHLGRNLKNRVGDRVKEELEGICLGKNGYIIWVQQKNIFSFSSIVSNFSSYFCD